MNLNRMGLINIKNNFISDAVGSVTVINLILAAVALFKDIFLAWYLGTSAQADAFLLAYFIPDTAGNNLLASALGVACVPVFSKLFLAGKPVLLKKSITSITVYFMAISMLLVVILFLTRDNIIYVLGSGFSENTHSLCIALLVLMLPILVVFPAIAIGTAILQVHQKFNYPALAPVFFNAIILVTIIYLYFLSVPIQKGVYLLAVATLTGVAAMLALICYTINKYHIEILQWPRFSELIDFSREIKDILKILLPYLCILLFSQSVYGVERYLASTQEVGSIAGLNYAFRIAQFPLWVFVAAVSTVAFPSMSKATVSGRLEELRNILNKSLHMVILITLPLTICLFNLRFPIISILLQRGSFDTNSLQLTAGILAGYSLTVISQGVVIICLRAFLAAGRIFVPLAASFTASGLNIILDFFLVENMGSAGLGYGAAAGALLNAFMLFCLMNRVMNLEWKRLLRGYIRILIANIPLLLVVIFLNKIWFRMAIDNGFAVMLGYAMLTVFIVLPVYIVSLRFFKAATFDIK